MMPDDTAGAATPKKGLWEKLTDPIVIGAVIAGIFTLVGVFLGGRASAPSLAPKTGTPSKFSGAPLRFSLKSMATAPWCSTFTGTGAIPAGDTLLLLDSNSEPNDQPEQPQLYNFDGTFPGPSDTWKIGPVYIRNNGKDQVGLHSAVDAIIVPNSTAALISSIGAYSAKGGSYWLLSHLPANLEDIHLDVVRGPNNQCS
jgi:hypothetical protein